MEADRSSDNVNCHLDNSALIIKCPKEQWLLCEAVWVLQRDLPLVQCHLYRLTSGYLFRNLPWNVSSPPYRRCYIIVHTMRRPTRFISVAPSVPWFDSHGRLSFAPPPPKSIFLPAANSLFALTSATNYAADPLEIRTCLYDVFTTQGL